MLTVACVLKSGGIYDASWVARLQAGVARHLSVPHRFVCLSDVEVPCERIPLVHDWPGWWSKIELFKLPGPVLFFDLDTAVTGDLSDIAAAVDDWALIALRDFYRPDGLGSGVMGWACDNSLFYERFASDAAGWQRQLGARGDQGFLEEATNRRGIRHWQDLLPGQIVSYKVHCRRSGTIPEGARVVCLHGLPKFADMPPGDPVRLAWEQAA